MSVNRVKSAEYHFTVEISSVVNRRGAMSDTWNSPPPSLVPVCALSKQKLCASCSTANSSMEHTRASVALLNLLHQSQNSHCSVLMQNAITFSIRTSLSQEVNGKHISHCVPAALILLMVKTPWRQIDLSLFRMLWVKRKYIWHGYNVRALSIWCIKEEWGREEVHVTSCLIWLESCLEGVFCCLPFLSVALILPVLLVGGVRFNLSRYKFKERGLCG